MKTTGLFSKFLLLTTAVAAFSSCNDKIEIPPIAISENKLYVIQTPSAGDENVMEYLPHFGFAWNGKEDLATGEISRNGMPMTVTTNKDLRVCQINPQEYKTDDIASLTGTYIFNPIGVKGHEWKNTFSVEFKGTESMGAVEVTEFGYANGKIYASFNKVDNATHYGFYLQPILSGSVTPYYAMPLNMYGYNLVNGQATQRIELEFNPKAYELYQGIPKYRITPIAFNSSAGFSVLRKAQDGAIYGELTGDDYSSTISFIAVPEE